MRLGGLDLNSLVTLMLRVRDGSRTAARTGTNSACAGRALAIRPGSANRTRAFVPDVLRLGHERCRSLVPLGELHTPVPTPDRDIANRVPRICESVGRTGCSQDSRKLSTKAGWHYRACLVHEPLLQGKRCVDGVDWHSAQSSSMQPTPCARIDPPTQCFNSTCPNTSHAAKTEQFWR